MVNIANDVTWLVGRTPLVELHRFAKGCTARLVGKLEYFNPSGSNKDRAMLAMIADAERTGKLRPGGTLLECSSGDTSASLAMVAAARGYRVMLTIPDDAGPHLVRLLRSLGVEMILTEAKSGMRGALQKLESLSREFPDAHVLQPFTNRANSRAHEQTAREVWQDTDGLVDVVVCPVGTGGTAAGCINFFKTVPKPVAVVAVEPAGCAVLSGKPAGHHGLPGLGVGFVPEILPVAELADVIAVEHHDACAASCRVATDEGLMVGPASGAVLHAALSWARDPAHAGKLIVTILPDRAERHPNHGALSPKGC